MHYFYTLGSFYHLLTVTPLFILPGFDKIRKMVDKLKHKALFFSSYLLMFIYVCLSNWPQRQIEDVTWFQFGIYVVCPVSTILLGLTDQDDNVALQS
jgi:hypothetical protein